MKTDEQTNFFQMCALTDEEWLEVPKEEILRLYKNCYTMLENYIKLSGEKVPDVSTFTSTEMPAKEMTDDHRELKDIILAESKKGNVVYATVAGLMTVPIDEFIKQPLDGLLYDLNRDVATILTLIDDPKWVNDFAVCKVISKLYTIAFPVDAKKPGPDEIRDIIDCIIKWDTMHNTHKANAGYLSVIQRDLKKLTINK